MADDLGFDDFSSDSDQDAAPPAAPAPDVSQAIGGVRVFAPAAAPPRIPASVIATVSSGLAAGSNATANGNPASTAPKLKIGAGPASSSRGSNRMGFNLKAQTKRGATRGIGTAPTAAVKVAGTSGGDVLERAVLNNGRSDTPMQLPPRPPAAGGLLVDQVQDADEDIVKKDSPTADQPQQVEHGPDEDSDESSSEGDYGPQPEKASETAAFFPESFTIRKHEKSVTTLAFDKSGSTLVTGCVEGKVNYFDFHGADQDFDPFREFVPVENHATHSVDYHWKTGDVLVASGDCHLRIFQKASYEATEPCHVTTIKGDYSMRDPLNTKGHTALVLQGSWHPAEEKVFLSCSVDGTVRKWHADGKLVGLDSHLPHSAVFKVLDRRNCFVGGSQGIYPHCFAVEPLACKKLVAGCNDGSLQLFFLDKPDRKPLIARHAHSKCITHLTFFDGKLFTRSKDGTMKMWNANHVFGPNLSPLHVWENLPCEEDFSNVVVITDLKNIDQIQSGVVHVNPNEDEQMQEKQPSPTAAMVATCTSGVSNSVQIFSLSEECGFKQMQVLFFDEAPTRIGYPLVRGSETEEINLKQLEAAQRKPARHLAEGAAGVGVSTSTMEAQLAKAVKNASQAHLLGGASGSATATASGSSKDVDAGMNGTSGDLGAEVETTDAPKSDVPDEVELPEEFARFTNLPDYDAIEEKKKALQEEKKRRKQLKKELNRQKKAGLIPGTNPPNAVPAGAMREDEDAGPGPEPGSFLADILAKTPAKKSPDPLRQLFVGTRSGKVVVRYSLLHSKRGVLYSMTAKKQEKRKNKHTQEEIGLQVFAADDRDAMRLQGIRLNRDGTLKEMGWKGKQKVKVELERRQLAAQQMGMGDVAVGELQKGTAGTFVVKQGPEAIHDEFTKRQQQLEQVDRSKLSIMTKTILGMEGIKLDEFGKSIMPEGITLIHEQNPQEVLRKYQPKPGEDCAYSRAYKNNPKILDYTRDEDDDEDKAQQLLKGQHCPKCGRKICTCGYMKRVADAEDPMNAGGAKKQRH